MRRKAGTTIPRTPGLRALAALLPVLASCGPASSSASEPAASAQASGAAAAPAAQPGEIDFYWLSDFAYDADDPWALTPRKIDPSPVPEHVRALDGQEISIVGLAMPLSWEEDGVSEFILTVGEDACEFGVTPRISEWMTVRTVGGWKVPLRNGQEVWVQGTLHVTEEVEDGRVIQLFALDAKRVL